MINRRAVLTFIFSGFGVFGLLILVAAFRQGWFSPSETYFVQFETGEGVMRGTPVSMSGLQAGSVTKVELDRHNKVSVEIKIQSKFAEHVRQGSKAVLGRPFIIGERAISITAGDPSSPRLEPGSVVPGEESLELTDLLSGGRLSPYFQTFAKLLEQLRIVVEGDGKAGSVNLVELYKQAYVALKAVEGLGREVGTIRKDLVSAPETKKILHDLAAASQHFEPLFAESARTLPTVTKLSGDVAAMMPQLAKTLQETTFTLQALQRSFILSGGVAKLKREQEEAEKAQRAPAAEH